MGPQALGVDTKLAGQPVKGIRALGEQGQGGPQALVAVRRALGVHSPSPFRQNLGCVYSRMNNFVHKACEGAVCWST